MRSLKNPKFTAPKDIRRFGGKFFVSPAGSRHLGEKKTSGRQGTLQFLTDMVNGHFKVLQDPCRFLQLK